MADTPGEAGFTAVIPYVYYENSKPDVPARNRCVYIELPERGGDRDAGFFFFHTDQNGKLCSVSGPDGKPRDSIWIPADTKRDFFLHCADESLAGPAVMQLTPDMCAKRKLQPGPLAGTFCFRVPWRPRLALDGVEAALECMTLEEKVDLLFMPYG